MSYEVWGDNDDENDDWMETAELNGWINPDGVSQAVRDVLAECDRQITEEGFTAEHDDGETVGQLARAGAVYALTGAFGPPEGENSGWLIKLVRQIWPTPWDWRWFKPKDRRRDLVRAASLLIKEIERQDRAEARKP